MKTVILYHSSCMDGTGARYAAWKKFGDNAEYFACQYGQSLPEFKKGPDIQVFLLDFSLPTKTELEALGEACGRVVVLDHHATAREALEGCKGVETVFDMNRSGAVIAWEYFHPESETPMLLEYVQDRDLWKFDMVFSKAVHSGLGLLKGRMEAWNNYAENEDEINKLIDIGNTLLQQQKQIVEAAVPKTVKVVRFNKYNAGILNTGEFVSEKGAAICEDKTLNVDLAIMWFVTKDNQVILSMRSHKDSGVNVAELCKAFGGGGHPNAAGCRVDFKTLEHILNDEWWTE
jgi:oligoribonuclease NrnB/cAMP/cGMP phosphodiesterase (DHH superfamily)